MLYVYVLEISGNSMSRKIYVIRLFCSTNTIAKHETSVQRLVFINYVCFYMHESFIIYVDTPDTFKCLLFLLFIHYVCFFHHINAILQHTLQ